MINLIERNSYTDIIKPFIGKPVIKIITGMRRVGKSKLLELIQKQIKSLKKNSEILSINMESLEYDFIKNYNDLYKYVKNKFGNSSKQKFLFVDEIQVIDKWEKAVNSLLSENIADIYITGSNAYMFSKELATNLTGRYITVEVFPLTFGEFLDFRQESGVKISVPEYEFNLFLKYGGLPAIHNFELADEIIYEYLYNIYNTIILKDVVSRNKIRDTPNLFAITKYVFDNCGNITSGKNISDFFKSQNIKISTDTVINYISHLIEANLIISAERYDIKGKKYLEHSAKYYMGDIGLRNGLIGYREKDISGILENIVFLQLKNRRYKVAVGKLDGTEIDFIAENSDGKIYIQVSYMLNSKKTIEREFQPLEAVSDNYPKYILSLDKFQKIERNGIIHQNLIDFLLNKK